MGLTIMLFLALCITLQTPTRASENNTPCVGAHRRLIFGPLGEMVADVVKDTGYYFANGFKKRPTSKPTRQRRGHYCTEVCCRKCSTCHYISCPVKREHMIRQHAHKTYTECRECGRGKYTACPTCRRYCSRACWVKHRGTCKSDRYGNCLKIDEFGRVRFF